MCLSDRLGIALGGSRRQRVVHDWIIGALASLLASVLAAQPASASTWTGLAGNGLWNTSGNWSGGVPNATGAVADFSTLNITTDNTVHMNGLETVGTLLFGDNMTPSNNWILDNNNGGGNILTLAVSSGSPTITVNNETATISAVVAGSQGLTKNGAGTLVLSGNDTYSGTTAISVGTLVLGNANALGSTAAGTTITSGATLDVGGQAVGGEGLTISGTGVGGNGALVNSSASAASLSGTVTAGAAFTVGGSGDITLSGSVNGGNQVLTKIGNNTLTLSGTTDNNSLAVTVNSGTVVLAKTSSGSPNDVHAIGQDMLTVNGGTAQLGGTGGDQIYDLGSVTVTSGTFDTNGRDETFATLSLLGTGIANAGALQLTGFNKFSTITPTNGTVLTGNATIGVSSASVLTLNNAVSGNFTLTKTGPGTLALEGTNTFSGGLTIQQGVIYVPTFNNAGVNGPLGNNTFVTLGASGQTGTIDFQSNGSSNMPFVLAAGGTGAFELDLVGGRLALSGVISGSGGLVKTGGTGTLSLNANNTFTGGVTITGGTLQLGNPGALNSSTPNAVAFSIPGILDALSLNGNSVTVSGLTAPANPATTVVQDANALSAVLTVNNSAANTFAGTLQDGAGGGSLGLTKSGSGTLTLSGNNTFTGGVTINGGNLQVGNPGALNSSFPNSVAFGPSSTGTLSLNGNSITISDLFANILTPVIQNANNTAAATLTINTSGIDLYGGTLRDGAGSAPLSLVKNGGGLINFLSATLTFTGSLTINAGDLEIDTGNSLTGGITINGSSTLELIGGSGGISSDVVTFGPGSTGTFLVNVSGTIGGLNTDASMVGAPIVKSGSFSSTLTINNSTSNTYAGVMQDGAGTTLSLAKSGVGTLTLAGAKTYSGSTTVSGGTLKFDVSSASNIGTGAVATIAGGATLELAGPVSALGAAGSNRASIMNNSSAPGLLVSGSHQVVGSIDGSGTTQVNAGSDLTANHIVQLALVIGGAAGSLGLVAIDASDASGNPLVRPSGLTLAGSLSSSGPFGAGKTSSASLSTATTDSTNLAISAAGNSDGIGNGSQVPEPSTLLLVLLAVFGVINTKFVRHHFRCQTV